jgi:endonuclease G
LNDRTLDYAVVAVKPRTPDGAPLNQFQFLPLIAVKGKIRKGDPVNIIQHPHGKPKQYATVNNQLLDLRDDGFLLYETDTLEGSSGSPVFNQHWETIGLHHCGVPLMEKGKLVTRGGKLLSLDAEVDDADLIWVANEGIRVSALVASLANVLPRLAPEPQLLLKQLLESTTDPLRMVETQSPVITGAPGAPAPLPFDREVAMSSNPFIFQGPVTIHVGSPPPAAAPTVTVAVPAPAAEAPADAFQEKVLKFDENYFSGSRKGYQAGFLKGWKIPAPTLNATRKGSALKQAGKPWVVPYYHYSLVMDLKRRLAVWTACNVDYSEAARKHTRTRKQYGGENWRLDPRVGQASPDLQIENTHFYLPAKKIDRGHLVRREDSAWGKTAKEAEFGNSDTYHWTNCTPQSEGFNQAGEDGIWGRFEEHIEKEVKAEGGRMSVFAGPVFRADDPTHGYEGQLNIKVPMRFWKVVACVSKEDGKSVRRAYGFIFDQTEPVQRLGFERMDMSDYKVEQKPIRDIVKATGVGFDAGLLAADVLKGGGATESLRGAQGREIRTLADVILR